MFMNIMDVTIVNFGLAHDRAWELRCPADAVDTVVIGLPGSARPLFIPASGWLGDRLLRPRRVLLTFAVIFTGCVRPQVRPHGSLGQLVLLPRPCRGAGGGLMVPVGMGHMPYRAFHRRNGYERQASW